MGAAGWSATFPGVSMGARAEVQVPVVPYASLADFVATVGPSREVPRWARLASVPLPFREGVARARLEDALETVVSLQRAEWLEDGVYLGPRAYGEAWTELLGAARVLGVPVPPGLATSITMARQGAIGTDGRAFVVSSAFFLSAASSGERSFALGRAVGMVAAGTVTGSTCYALLTDTGGIGAAARKVLGPALELLVAPVSLGARLALSRWHRAAEVVADRAGLLVCRSVDDAGRAMLRVSLGGQSEVDPSAYLDQLRAGRAESPGRFAELIADRPWLHKRLAALELFASSAAYAEVTGITPRDPIDDDTLERRTRALLAVG